jgi:hypothetical protein
MFFFDGMPSKKSGKGIFSIFRWKPHPTPLRGCFPRPRPLYDKERVFCFLSRRERKVLPSLEERVPISGRIGG